MSAELSIEMETGVVFRNPMAHVTSRHAYFPSAIPLGNGEVLVSYNVGEAFEAENLRVHLSRSLDGDGRGPTRVDWEFRKSPRGSRKGPRWPSTATARSWACCRDTIGVNWPARG
ncbi:MAG: hypothetical protein Ct9H300mP1_21870 [Planctomycetaceae bacterium]|nr:MAG: hypothetical protein Ct9H300mP1_21870 [Planctomycetaceae bacterium]